MSTITQIEKLGLFELSQEAKQELATSKFYNEDLAPSSVSERTWTTYNITMLWVGMSICIPALALASGLIGMGVSPWLSVLNVAIGNLIVLIPMQLNSTIGTKYGIPFPLFARLTFGVHGAHLPTLLRAFTAIGWCSVQSWVGGGAFAAIIGCFAPRFLDAEWTINLPSWGGMQTASAGTFIGFILFMGLVAWVAYNGLENIKWVQNIGGPILLAVMIGLLIWSYSYAHDATGMGFWEVMKQPNDMALVKENGGMAYVYLTGVMGNIAFWATVALNIPDFSRYAKSNGTQFWGQMLGMPLPMAFCGFVGAYFAQATKLADGVASFDPTTVFYYIDNKIAVFVAAIGVIMATITTCCAANVVAPANGIANIKPRNISYKMGVIITCFMAFFILQAWWIYGSGSAYFTWMNAYGTILAPVAGILVADYWIVKKQKIDIKALFLEDGRYSYTKGWNWAAVIAWFAAFILPLLLYFGVDNAFFTAINSINYIWSFVVGMVVYIILMKTSMAGNSFVTEEEYAEITKFE